MGVTRQKTIQQVWSNNILVLWQSSVYAAGIIKGICNKEAEEEEEESMKVV